jgi:hypothetical protein
VDERVLLERLEDSLTRADEAHADEVLTYLAGQSVELDEDELRGSLRRAVQLQAAGGDVFRGLDVDGRAVQALADDLDTEGRRGALAGGLQRLSGLANDLPQVAGHLEGLQREPDRAWRRYACALLAEELAGEGDQE